MPKRTDIQSILIIGAGPIVIGQACEFDYSGAQACKALREEGYRVILVNSNPATIMTDPDVADPTYIEPITVEVLKEIIEKERPDALLPTMGGQTALNCALALHEHGVLEKYGVEMIGAKDDAIEKAEDREAFKRAIEKAGLEYAKSGRARNREEALAVLAETGFPSIIRPSFTLGGTGGGIAYNREEFESCVEARPFELPDPRGADRGVGHRLEGVRDGGGARQARQLHHRLLDREPRPDGRPHRRLDHRRAGADADRQGIPAHARRLDRGSCARSASTPAARTCSSRSTRRATRCS
ncbi:MAG: hypothetical protein MPW13_02450 [Candidatus Manganitrophus sp.]|nr:hypothetical protein [Candidatus Manganitrophus sp.]